jgi:predicted transcriptional regulator
MSPDDIKQSMVPSDIVKSIMDMTDKSTAKELSSVEAAVTSLITKLNTPPRIEDIDREIEEVKEMTDKIPAIGKDVDELKRGTVQIPIIANSIDDVVRKVGGIISDIEKFRDIISKTTEKIDKIIDEANKPKIIAAKTQR